MSTEQRKQAPYIFYGQTTSLCEECMDLVPAKILIEDNDVFYQKRCKTHGVQKTKISSDSAYFKWCKDFIKPGDRPHKYQTRTEYGCPLDCGLCADHEQHSCLALIEVNEECNLECPVCFAESSPARKKNLSLEQIESIMDALVESEGEPDVLQISGGEPTIHPQILDILKLAKTKPIRHLMINTNGVRLARDRDFVQELSKLSPGFEIYLQFDSLEKSALENLRGIDLRTIRRMALDNLEKFNISTTLVVTVKKGVNDHEIGAIIDHALNYKCVRGITFQPVQDAGRNEKFNKNEDRFLLTDIRRAIYEQSDIFAPEDIIPLPCNPESISIAYGLRDGRKITPVTSLIPQEELIAEVPNAVSFEKNLDLKQKVIDLFSLSSGDLNTAERMESLLCCLPEVPALKNLGYENIFRITIVQFLDRYNFCVGNVKRSCIHFVTPEKQIIPFDTYNLFYRNGLVHDMRKRIRGIL
ncbi:radical SAM protein [Micavibrio aeruginosavorus]|uniref:Radical SAM superfamily protein n=1 Tax=Micavibrio aeruginosavorus (strain ARL-13) TaxID=856793 RepID=G2KPH7_MICAA|nr:radical SAM superfamily protein [Micavibrio aeruginosavorus ARL-13]